MKAIWPFIFAVISAILLLLIQQPNNRIYVWSTPQLHSSGSCFSLGRRSEVKIFQLLLNNAAKQVIVKSFGKIKGILSMLRKEADFVKILIFLKCGIINLIKLHVVKLERGATYVSTYNKMRWLIEQVSFCFPKAKHKTYQINNTSTLPCIGPVGDLYSNKNALLIYKYSASLNWRVF